MERNYLNGQNVTFKVGTFLGQLLSLVNGLIWLNFGYRVF